MKPVCVSCERFMRPKKNGFYFSEGMPHGSEIPWDGEIGKNSVGWSPYKIWVGDLWECPTCLTQIIIGVGPSRLSEHYEPEFTKIAERTGANKLLVKDC